MSGSTRVTARSSSAPAIAAICLAAAVPPCAAWDDYYPRPSPGQMVRDTLVRDTARALSAASAAMPAPIPAVPGRFPRLVFRERLAAEALSAGVPMRQKAFRIHVLETDSGTIYAADRPVPAGKGSMAFLRLLPHGEVRPETLPLSRIRSIAGPDGRGDDWLALGGLVILPIAFGLGPFPFLAGLGFGAGASVQVPEWTGPEPPEVFGRRAGWNASFAMTTGLMQRSIFNAGDYRADFVPVLHARAEAGARRSAFAFGLGVRIAAMRSPVNPEPPHVDTGWWGFDPAAQDTAYRNEPMAIALSPTVSVTWAERPSYVLRTRAGGFLSLTAYPEDHPQVGPTLPMGAEFGTELDLRLAPHWSMRLEGALISVGAIGGGFSDFIDFQPALGLGLAYSVGERPAPGRSPGALVSGALALSPYRFLPGVQWERDLDAFQSLGLAAAHSGRRRTGGGPGSQSTYRFDRHASTTSVTSSYGFHTDRSLRFHAGIQLCAGIATTRSIERDESAYRYADGRVSIERGDTRSMDTEFAWGLVPELGMRLGKGLGLRLRFHPMDSDPFAADAFYRLSLGLTYAIATGTGKD